MITTPAVFKYLTNAAHDSLCAIACHFDSLRFVPIGHKRRYEARRQELIAEGVPACDCGLDDLRTLHGMPVKNQNDWTRCPKPTPEHKPCVYHNGHSGKCCP